ncbi:MAG: hypothetical protein IJS28_04400 [Synergistaceae bacterium]|nr:hypothetical protein [Synergistaceae bacterium]
MADNTSIFEQLRADNPFVSFASPLPWENDNPDLLQLNSEVSAEIEQLIMEKRRNPSLPLSGLIFGGEGIGKTHMLSRILRKLRKNAWKIIFVTVRTLTNPKRINQELLSEILLCMNRPHSEGRTQFDMLMDEVMSAYHEHRLEDTFSSVDKSDMKFYLKRDLPGIDKNFLKCLLLYLKTNDRIVKDEIIDWLREGLDEEESQKLGLSMRDATEMEDTECDSFAKNIIISLGSLLAYAHIPMIVCFDELDFMKHNTKLIESWGDVVAFMMNTISGVLPLCFIKIGIWDDVFRPVLNVSIVHRLQAGQVNMNGCSIAQAKQLIHDRIAARFSDGAEEKYNWLINRMGNTLHEGDSPRTVIELARKALRDPTDPVDSIKETYEDACKKVRSESWAWPPKSEHLVTALRAWLISHEGCEIVGGYGKYIKLLARFGGKYYAFSALAPKSASTATAGANECLRFIEESPESFCCYVMEKKAHKPTWRKFQEKLSEFSAAGGSVLVLDDDSRIAWYALASLVNQISNGSVNIYSFAGSRIAALSDAGEFLRSIDLVPGVFAAVPQKPKPATPMSVPEPKSPVPIPEPNIPVYAPDPKSPVPVPEHKPDTVNIDSEKLRTALTEMLKSSPMKILAAEKAVTLLAGRDINITYNELLAFLGKCKSSFRVYPSKSGSDMIGLAGQA